MQSAATSYAWSERLFLALAVDDRVPGMYRGMQRRRRLYVRERLRTGGSAACCLGLGQKSAVVLFQLGPTKQGSDQASVVRQLSKAGSGAGAARDARVHGHAEVRGDYEAVARSCERQGGWQGKRHGLDHDPWVTAIGQRARAGGRAGGQQSSGLAATVLRVCAVGLVFRVLPPARRGLGVPSAEQDDGAQGRDRQSRAEYRGACGGVGSRACARLCLGHEGGEASTMWRR